VEHPILFDDEMMRAIRAGRKTRTTRLITDRHSESPQTHFASAKGCRWERDWRTVGSIRYVDGEWRAYLQHFAEVSIGSVKCPYGKPGDLLYCKEAYRITSVSKKSNIIRGVYLADMAPFVGRLDSDEWDKWSRRKQPYAKTSGRFMYKSLSRLWLIIKDVKAMRVQDITEVEAIAEGLDTDGCCLCPPDIADGVRFCIHCNKRLHDFVEEWSQLWDSICGPGAWDRNDWVWSIKFAMWPEYRQAVGAAPGFLGDTLPEDVIRKGRD